MESELVVYDVKPLRAADVRAQVNLIQEVMKSVMQKDVHYGVIPGAGTKPTLLKAGAEKIMSTFRLAADPDVEDMSTETVIRYRVKCKLISASGSFVGAGLGECSTAEEKYAWRGIVSEGEWNATDEADRRAKFRRDGQVKQVRTNPYDLSNTILKMAKKRALVDAVLTVTGASDIFTQDIEDMPAEVLNQKPPVSMPQEKKAESGYAPNSDRPATIKDPDAPVTDPQIKAIGAILCKLGVNDDMARHEKVSNILALTNVIPSMRQLTKGQASDVIQALSNEANQ